MGITANDSKFLFYAKNLGVSFSNTLTLGRQMLYVKKSEITGHAAYFGNASVPVSGVEFPDEYCEPLLKILGAV
ncbi:MAG TPA: hypothetical protein VD905_08015, partial [Flavobacteriales bacterium]|nr:hypothetical protein [Flavobacteriales bacterium]